MGKGDLIRLIISGISHDGSGVSRIDGKVAFVAGALPGEEVMAKITEDAQSYMRAELSEIIKGSEARQTPFCDHYGECGGCSLQHVEYHAGLALKRESVQNAITRIGRFVDVEVLPVIGMEQPFGYRNKAEYRIEAASGKVIAGFRRRSSHACVNLTECHIVPEASLRLLSALKAELNGLEDVSSAGIRHAVVRTGRKMQMMLCLVSTSPSGKAHVRIANTLAGMFPDLRSIYHSFNPQLAGEVIGRKNTLLYGSSKIECEVGGFAHMISPTSFLQVNSPQTEKLYSEALSAAALNGDEPVLDVYCGIGTITLMLAKAAKQVIGIEQNPEAIKDAEADALRNGVQNSSFMVGKAEHLLGSDRIRQFGAKVAVLDPPRAGCDDVALRRLAGLGLERIVYISCDPATLSRDASKLAAMGFSLIKVQPVDMFPYTSHVETVVLMSRAEAGKA